MRSRVDRRIPQKLECRRNYRLYGKCDSDVMLSKLIFMQYYTKYSVEILVRIIGLGYSV